MSSEKSVMIVNDNTDLLSLFKNALEHEGIQTYAFVNPTLALEKIRANPNHFSIVLINYASQIKKSQRRFAKDAKTINEQIKVILTSGYDLTDVDISKEKYDGFMRLPVELSVLVSRVKGLLVS